MKKDDLSTRMTPEMLDRIDQLEKKYAVMGQDMLSYLDGLLYADYLTYWDYIHLDTLLSLQTPRTRFPDERIFIIYHQITELYFKLSIQAIEQLIEQETPDPKLFKRQLIRLNGYWDNLIHSFDIMVNGMDKEEFLKFRMSLLPASGFQSAQYRQIEIMSTDLHFLVRLDLREPHDAKAPVEAIYPRLYWKSGATELATGRKTLTLGQFESKYSALFLRLAADMRERNLWQCFQRLAPDQKEEELIDLMKEYDFKANVRWRLSHLHAASRYLDNKPRIIEATGGTNWQKYLPPRNQRVVFFPELWEKDELENWGRKR